MKPIYRQPLEMFRLVVLREGLAPAARACGLDRSTLNRHIRDLETECGVALFVRSPFRLLPAGRLLFDALEAGHERVGAALADIAREARPRLRFIAAETVNQCYLPEIQGELEKRDPRLECSTESGTEERIHDLLRAGTVDLAIAPERDDWGGFRSESLVELPLALLCPAAAGVRTAADLWGRPAIGEVLFVSGAFETATRRFDAGLRGLQVAWPNRRRVSSALVVADAVAAGRGFGLTVDVAPVIRRPRVRVVPLPGFPPVTIAVYWRDPAPAALRPAITLMREVAERIQGRPERRGRTDKAPPNAGSDTTRESGPGA